MWWTSFQLGGIFWFLPLSGSFPAAACSDAMVSKEELFYDLHENIREEEHSCRLFIYLTFVIFACMLHVLLYERNIRAVAPPDLTWGVLHVGVEMWLGWHEQINTGSQVLVKPPQKQCSSRIPQTASQSVHAAMHNETARFSWSKIDRSTRRSFSKYRL